MDLTSPYLKQATRIPHAEDGMRIGLFGGSFNPPHQGHVHVSEMALNKVGLDRVWWLVTPGNPLKDTSNLSPLEERIRASREISSDPRIEVTAFEARHKTRYTADTLRLIKRYRPRVKFVWVMGADNLKNFHHWQDWRSIADMMPMAVIDRPGSTFAYRASQAAIALGRYRIDDDDASILPGHKTPAWSFIHGPRNSLSSTAIRRASGKKK